MTHSAYSQFTFFLKPGLNEHLLRVFRPYKNYIFPLEKLCFFSDARKTKHIVVSGFAPWQPPTKKKHEKQQTNTQKCVKK